MRHPRITAAAIAVAVGATVAGVTVASAAGSSTPEPAAGAAQLSPATVQIATAMVRGAPETILEDAHGMPLYTYQPDTAATSRVTGHLAVLWPPLVAKNPTGAGIGGTLRSVKTDNGLQVSYNGHFLYTFVEDHAGQVTGQGVQSFFVATPDLAALRSATTTPPPAPAPTPGGNGYGSDNGYGY